MKARLLKACAVNRTCNEKEQLQLAKPCRSLYGEKKKHAGCHKHAQRQLNEAFSGEELELFQADQ